MYRYGGNKVEPSLKQLFKIGAISTALVSTACTFEDKSEIKTSNVNSFSQSSEYKKLIMLTDFDDTNLKISNENANHKLVKNDDGMALKIEFSDNARYSGIHLEFQKPQDWSKFNEYHMALDVENAGDESVQLFLSIDSNDQSLHRIVTIPKGEKHTLFAPLDGIFWDLSTGIRENPKPWDTDDLMFQLLYGTYRIQYNNVTRISLNTRSNMADKTLIVDNIQLRKNPGYDLSFVENFVDEFGQNAKVDFPSKVHSSKELKAVAEKELLILEQTGPLPDRSRFGGWKMGPKLDATGYFRTTKINGKWWMVDPDGYLFFSHGVANVRLANLFTITGMDFKDDSIRYRDPEELTPEDSIGLVTISDKVQTTRYVTDDTRRRMFTWLPSHDEPLGKHYSYRRSIHSGPVKSGETYSFYRANLERRYGETYPDSFIKTWEETTLNRMQAWGFTSMGNWVDPAFYPNEQVPYFANGWIIGDFKEIKTGEEIWHAMPDVFDPEFERRANLTIEQIAKEIQGSPWCAGIFVDNEKTWGYPNSTVERKYFLPIAALSLDAAESPAKSEFSDYLIEKYQTISALNQSWNTNIEDFSELKSGIKLIDFNSNVEQDLSAMLSMLSNKYFKVVHDAIERVLPNHLYMGVRMATWGMPEETVQAAVKYTDVLSFNVYNDGLQPAEWEFLREIDLPAIIGEFHVGAISDNGLTHPGLISATDQEDRARKYRVYMDSVSGHDNFVGAHWFQYIDSPLTGRAFDGESYNVGFVNSADIPYESMVNMAKDFNGSLYPTRFNRPLTQPTTQSSNNSKEEALPN